MKRPFLVEFTGTPEAGKTTSIKRIIPLLEDTQKLKVRYVRESAEIAPDEIPKGSFDSNVWIKLHAFIEVLAASYDTSNEIVIIDRGIIDGQFFNFKFRHEGGCSEDELKFVQVVTSYNSLLPHLLIHLKTTPEEAIRRRGGEGRLVTLNWVTHYNRLFDEFLATISVPLYSLDTTGIPQSKVIDMLVSKIHQGFLSYSEDN